MEKDIFASIEKNYGLKKAFEYIKNTENKEDNKNIEFQENNKVFEFAKNEGRAKTPEEAEFIKNLEDWLKEDFKKMDIGVDFPDSLGEHIHIVDGGDDRCDGTTVFMNERYIKDFGIKHFAHAVTHEIIHLLSHNLWEPNRSGYSTEAGSNLNRKTRHPYSDYYDHFSGLNEAVVEKFTIEILNKHFQEIAVMNIFEKKENESDAPYAELIKILNTIIEKIAESMKESENTVWVKFKRGLFTGNMIHLRDVEKIYGYGALRILATLKEELFFIEDEPAYKYVSKYFNTTEKSERDKIAQKILKQKFLKLNPHVS